MWQQWSTHGEQVLQAEAEESGHFLSFVKRSREVQRSSAVTVRLPARDLHHSSSSSSSSLCQCGENFWDKTLTHPCEKTVCYDLCYGHPLNTFSREPAEMVCAGVRGVRGARGEENLSVDTLPSPAQLMGRRKKGGGRVQRGDAAQRQAAAVTQHIGDLRRKQSAVEQMKKEKWWGSTLGYTPENSCSFDVRNLTSPETPWSLDPSHAHTQHNAQSPTHLNTGTINPQSVQMFTGYEEMINLAPGGNPMMSFVVTGTAHREAQRNWDTPCLDTPYVATPHVASPYLDTPRLCHTEFWGFPSIM